MNINFLVILNQDIPAKILMNHRIFLKMGGKKDNIAFINGNRVFGERGLVTEIGSDIWYHKRRVMDAAFHKNSLRDLHGQMNDIAKKLSLYLEEAKQQENLDIYPVLIKVALEAICRCGFNLNDDIIFSKDVLLTDAFKHIFYATQLQFQCCLKFALPWCFRKEKDALKKHIDMIRSSLRKHLKAKIESDKKNTDNTKDMLHYIIKGNSYQDKLDIEDVVDDFFVFVVAGTETSAIVMALVLWYLMKNPEISAKVQAEVEEAFGDGDSISFDDINKLPFLEQCIKETMRIHPPAQATLRVNWNEAATVNGLYIPKEAHIMMSEEIVQRRADIWPDPMKFDPDRFSPDAPRIKPFTYMPFMAGPRSCIGKHFAMLEMKVMISRIFKDFTLVDPRPEMQEIAMKTVVTSKPKDGVYIGFKKR
ncbi:cholesterol 24-hydroxylase-like [Bolinopsis microptera]|uniref:cholesterol 24-hydroxylase-like n=1 Tax=Bolinopsis microptera TaxID=2820187 RepID=UPI003079A316